MSLKHSLLALLSRNPKTGYDLSKDVQGTSGFFWTATHQQIYRELGELRKAGWVRHKDIAQTEKPDKKVYSTTKEGLTELKRWLSEKSEPAPIKDGFLIKLFAGNLTDPKVLLEDLLNQKEIRLARRGILMDILKEHFSDVDNMPLEHQYQYLTLRRGITFENAWLSWCKEVEEFLERKVSTQDE